MAEVKWIKITTELFDNRKIKQIESLPDSDAIIVIWLKLLCLSGNINDNGYIYLTNEMPYTDQMLSTQFGKPLSTIRLALQTFQQFGMIEIIDDVLKISNWEKYQNIEGLDKIREQNKLRKQRQREREKVNLLESGCESSMSRDTSRDVTQQNKNKILDIDKDIKSVVTKVPTSLSKKIPPDIEDVKAYITDKGYSVNADMFIDFYESKGWVVGKQRMKDWKAAVRTWERRDSGRNNIKRETERSETDFSEYDKAIFKER